MSPAYLSGFGNEFATEAVAGALPVGRNSPQRPPLGLYAEQLSGTAFTAPRAREPALLAVPPPPVRRARARSERMPTDLRLADRSPSRAARTGCAGTRCRCRTSRTDFIDGLTTIGGNGDPTSPAGVAVHVYLANRSMETASSSTPTASCWSCRSTAAAASPPSSACSTSAPARSRCIPRGMSFRVELPDGSARGYVCENSRRAASGCPISARSAPTASPIRATS